MSTTRCSTCGIIVPTVANFCPNCGNSMLSPRQQLSRVDTQGNDAPHVELVTQVRVGEAIDQFEVRDAPIQRVTWHKELEPRLPPVVKYPPRPTPPQRVPFPLRVLKLRVQPTMFFWISILLLNILIFGGTFGIITVMGSASADDMTLSVAPGSVVVGATTALRGAHFSPRGHIALLRDSAIRVVDTGGSDMAVADEKGNFTDTVIVGNWGSGLHTLSAVDITTQKRAAFSIIINGAGSASKPPHLLVAQTALDFGSGDETTSSAKLITLMNVGDGQVSWKVGSLQPWLQVAPGSGSLHDGLDTQLTVTATRANKAPGRYSAQLAVSSNAGSISLPVSMQVTQLQMTAPQSNLPLAPFIIRTPSADPTPTSVPVSPTLTPTPQPTPGTTNPTPTPQPTQPPDTTAPTPTPTPTQPPDTAAPSPTPTSTPPPDPAS